MISPTIRRMFMSMCSCVWTISTHAPPITKVWYTL